MPTSFSVQVAPLTAAVQNYAWGLPASPQCIVSRIYSANCNSPVDSQLPYAELWVGTHRSAPARVGSDTLSDYLQAHGLPAQVPYLLKILSVARPLSIQAHPDRALAAQLHAANPAAYRDANHKPEMAVALTAFEGMCNFQSAHLIESNLRRFPSLLDLCGGQDTVKLLLRPESKKEALRSVFGSLMKADVSDVHRVLNDVFEIASNERSQMDDLFLRLVGYYPGDVGCLAAYLLNHVRISPGQAFFMAANEPHAYLKGQCVEIMACSDNVVRAGLTPKFKDVSTLVDMLTYQDGPPKIMDGHVVDKFSRVYQPPAEEFQLTKVVIPAGEKYELPAGKGVGMIMVVEGIGALSLADGGHHGKSLPLAMGNIYVVTDTTTLVVEAYHNVTNSPSPDLFFFSAGVNQTFAA